MPRAVKDKKTGLTPKQTLFCELVAFDPEMSLSDAYRSAYNCARMKAGTINRRANELVNSGMIAAMVATLRERRAKRVEIDADYVLRRLGEIDSLDVADILEDDGTLLPISKWPKPFRTLVSAIDVAEISAGGNVLGLLKKIKLPDKVRNLELIGKHVDVQAFKDRVEIFDGDTITKEQRDKMNRELFR